MFVDDNGADIVLAGKNKSSVTVITDRIDIQVNLSRIGVDWGGNYQLQGEKILSTALDIAGIFDPTGTLDVTNAGLQWKNGNHLGSLVSLIGVIPYAGDIAKAGRISKEVKAINTSIKSGQSAIDKGFKSLEELGLKDGMKASSSQVLDYGELFLGKGYKETSPGRFISADEKRVFRIGNSDLNGHNGGLPHANFETLVANPQKIGKVKVEKNYHIYLIE